MLKKNHKPTMAYSQKEYERDHQMVRGTFRNIETPGASLSFPFRKYYTDGIQQYTFKDGQEQTIPFMVANHLNENCCYYETDQKTGLVTADGQPITTSGSTLKKKPRFAFVPTSFRRIDEELLKTGDQVKKEMLQNIEK